jgi:ring-1,2-phenylacetyl-CoA epoxidase subunit PaaE
MNIKVITDKKEFNFNSNGEETILETLLRNNFDAPYSCELGFCAICPVKLIDGDINCDDDSILTEKEKESNIIVTCQSYPQTDIIIEYH